MKNLKKLGYGLVLFIGVLTALFFAAPAHRALADNVTDMGQICVPPYTPSGSASHHTQSGWLSVSFTDRAHMVAKYSAQGNCASPAGYNSDTFFGNRTFAQIFQDISGQDSTLLLTDNRGDSNVSYNEAVGSGQDDTRIDQFDGNLDNLMSDNVGGGGHDRIVDTSTLQKMLQSTEITLGLEADKVGYGCGDPSWQNENFVLVDGNPPQWKCVDSTDISGYKGFLVGADNYTDLDNFNVTYTTSVDGGNVTVTPVYANEQGERTFSYCPGPGKFLNKTCQGDITLNATKDDIANLGSSIGTFTISDSKGNSVKVMVAGANNAISQTSTGTTQSDSGPSCNSNFSFGFEWIMCPVLHLADSTAGAFNGFIEDQLDFCTGTSSTTGVSCQDNNLTDQVKKAWAIFRLLSSVALVIVLLIMVISEALGFGMFDAYTIRKTLPKLVVAVILIQISWVMFKFFIDLSNDLGNGIRDLLFAPFGGSDAVKIDKLVGHGVSTATGGKAGADAFSFFFLLAGLGAAWVTLPGIFTLAFMVVFSLLTAFVTLIFRKLLIIVLVILSPAALICWIMPGLDRYWKMWLTNFQKILLMFPMIMALIAGGRIFAYITAGNSTTQGGVTNFAELAIIVIAYFGPYFILPKTYAWGGQFMQMGANAIKGGVDKIKAKPMEYAKNRGESWREERRQKSKERVAEGKYFTKNPLSLFTGTADKFKSGQWDPLLGRKRVSIAGHQIMSDSRRRERTVTNYKAGGAQAEEEDLKNAKLSNELEYGSLDESIAEDYVRAKARGNIMEAYQDQHGRWQLRDTGRKATLIERRAALDKLATLGGEGNFGIIQDIHNDVVASDDEDAKKMMSKYKDANAQTLFKKLPHLYKNYDYADPNGAHPRDVIRTVDGLTPEDMTAISGVGLRAMRDNLVSVINDPSASAQSRTDAANALRRMATVYQQATQDENLRGHINVDVSRRMREFADGVNPDGSASVDLVQARNSLGIDGIFEDIRHRVQEGTGVVLGEAGAGAAATPGPGTNIPAGGVTIPHNAPEARIVSATDFDLQNWANSVGGWDNIPDDELIHVYNYRSGAIKDAAEQALRRKGLIS